MMNVVEFECTVTADGQIAIAAEIAKRMPLGKPLHVVVQWDGANGEDGAWRTLGRQHFEASYVPELVMEVNWLKIGPGGGEEEKCLPNLKTVRLSLDNVALEYYA